jgi:hypothetical protein
MIVGKIITAVVKVNNHPKERMPEPIAACAFKKGCQNVIVFNCNYLPLRVIFQSSVTSVSPW